MTAENKNKIIAILHLVMGGLAIVSTIVALVFVFAITNAISKQPAPPNSPSPILFAVVMCAVTLLFAIVFGGSAFAAGYGLLKRKSWARKIAVISSAIALLNFPLGMAIGFYSLWFLLSDEGKQFYQANKFV